MPRDRFGRYLNDSHSATKWPYAHDNRYFVAIIAQESIGWYRESEENKASFPKN